jgi:hypothetical protein
VCTHLDDTVTYGGATRCPGERGIEIGHVDEIVPTELLLRVRVRTIQYLRLPIRKPHGRGSRARLKVIAALKDARCPQVLGAGGEAAIPCSCSAFDS